MNIGAVIVCAGTGIRLGRQDKATLRLAHKPLFYHAVKAFCGIKEIKQIVLVLHPKNIACAKNIINSVHLRRYHICIVEGGPRRCDSVQNGLRALDDSINYTLIHDGARPFVSRELIGRIVKALKRYPAVICGLRLRDTLKLVNTYDFVRNTMKRENIVSVQTPQGFKKELLLNAYKSFPKKNPFDDAQLVEALGIKVKVVAGDIRNFKITYPEDVELAKYLLKTDSKR